ncbi:MAG: FeoA family protein [Balneola sp.]
MALLLSEISTPDTYTVKAIQGVDTTRILEMGITPGVQIQLLRKAPLGFPIEIKVRGYLLTLRESEAKCIEVAVK